MPATPARIGFVLEQWRPGVAETQSVRDLFGDLARESDDPIEAFFDDTDDAETMAEARQDLLSPMRRRFQATAKGLDEALALDFLSGTIPNARYIDEERTCDRRVLVCQAGFDFDRQHATFMVWG
jgi:hypothetical protein